MKNFIKTESDWEGHLKGDWENIILPYAEKLGAKSIGTIGKIGFDSKNTYISKLCKKKLGAKKDWMKKAVSFC